MRKMILYREVNFQSKDFRWYRERIQGISIRVVIIHSFIQVAERKYHYDRISDRCNENKEEECGYVEWLEKMKKVGNRHHKSSTATLQVR